MIDSPRIVNYQCPATKLVYQLPIPPLEWPEPMPGPADHPLNARRLELLAGRSAPLLEPMLGLADEDRGSAIEPGSKGPGISIPDYATTYRGKKLPISNSLPRRKLQDGVRDTFFGHEVVRHKDGGLTDLHGRPIVDSKEADHREARRTGFERVGRGEPDPEGE